MRKVHFVQADVFSDSPFGGNPVVVVPDPGPMTPDERQALARGMSFSETAFIRPARDPAAAFGLFCHTPTTEVAYSGHQLLGAAYVLASAGRLPDDGPETSIQVEVGDGLRTVTLVRQNGEVVRLSAAGQAARFLDEVHAYGDVAAALSIDLLEIVQFGLPLQLVDAGLACLVVPLRSLHAVRDVLPVSQAIDGLLRRIGGACIVAFASQTLDPANDLHVRVFAPPLGIDEDPATGSANAALAAYLVRHGIVTDRPSARLRSEQGTEMGRPSLIELEVDTTTDPATVLVGGRVAKSIEGTVFY